MLSLVVFLPLAGALALLAMPNKDGSRDGAIRWRTAQSRTTGMKPWFVRGNL